MVISPIAFALGDEDLSMQQKISERALAAEGITRFALHIGDTLQKGSPSANSFAALALCVLPTSSESTGEQWYDGSNAGTLLERLMPVMAGIPRDDLLRGALGKLPYLVDSLRLLEIFEEGGLQAVNDRIAEHFGNLKATEDPDRQNQIMSELNRLMQTAIFAIPHVATSVRIDIKAETYGRGEDIPHLIVMPGEGRAHFDAAVEKGTVEKRGGSYRLVLPLPFGFDADTCRIYRDRAGLLTQNEEFQFGWARPSRGEVKKVPVIKAAIQEVLLSPNYANFFLQEVEGVSLGDDLSYTPYLHPANSRPCQPGLSRISPGAAYMRFKGFIFCGNYLPEKVRGLDSLVRECFQELAMTPDHEARLGETEYPLFGKPIIKRGFLAEVSAKGTRLFAINDLKQLHDNDSASLALIYAGMLRGDKRLKRTVTSHEGMAVIERLMVEQPRAGH